MKRLIAIAAVAVGFTLLSPPIYSLGWDPGTPRYVHMADLEPSPSADMDPYDIEKSGETGDGPVISPCWWLELGYHLFWFVSDVAADEEPSVTLEEDHARTSNTTAN